MTCYYPINGYRSKAGRDPVTGKWPVVFDKASGYVDQPVTLPCGRCIGCRLARSKSWAVRCVHEASLHEKNCFITLTYKTECLPPGGTLVKKHFQDFFKRLRKRHGEGIRYFHCGEYGSKNFRPHYHACIFGFDFDDKKLWSVRGSVKLFRSAELERLWPYGFSTIGDVTVESAAYVARYVMKKWLGRDSEDHPVNYETGEVMLEKIGEYTTMSRRPGIGRDWIDSYAGDIYPRDDVIIGRKHFRPPSYYDNVYDNLEPDKMRIVRRKRRKKAVALAKENDYNRLDAKHAYKVLVTKKLIRGLENGT